MSAETSTQSTVALDDLTALFSHPAKQLMRRATSVSLREWRDDVPTSLPVDLSGLTAYRVGNRLLADVLRGHDPHDALFAERLRGDSPPGALGQRQLEATMANVGRVAREVNRARADHQARTLDVAAALSREPGDRVLGRLEVYGDTLVDHDFSWTNGAHIVTHWLRLLTLAVAEPDRHWRGALIRRSPLFFTAPPAPLAQKMLSQWLTVYHQGLSQIVLLPPQTLAVLVELVAPFSSEHLSPAERAARQWRRERDEDWQRFSPEDLPTLLNAPMPDGRQVEQVARDLWGQIAPTARSRS